MWRRALADWLRDLSIRYKLSLSILVTSVLALLMTASALTVVEWRAASDLIRYDLDTLSEVMAANSTAAISFQDPAAAAEVLGALKAHPNVDLACIFSQQTDGLTLFAQYRAQNYSASCSRALLITGVAKNQFAGRAEIRHANETLGQLLIIENDSALWAIQRSNWLAITAILLGSLGLAIFLSHFLQRLISKPIIALARAAGEISASRDFSIRSPEFGNDEVGSSIKAFNVMLAHIENAERQLRELNSDLELQVQERMESNQTLQHTLDQLRSTQDQLVQTEKMASLGGLVAGVAHEINTPVGIGVTAASTLNARSLELKQSFESETLTANQLGSYLELVDQSTNIILSNLERASNLIQSFKQVAVDQSSLDHRNFVVKQYLDEIMTSLRPNLKHTQIKLELDCPDDLSIESYPGVFSQILTNLVMNALIHAFEPDQAGTIKISIRPTDTGLAMDFSDNGRGIDAEGLAKVFEPFYTTRRGQGGSGLGLHIIYNLITQQLGGNVQVRSTLGEGTAFHIEIKSKQHAESQPIATTG
ncbi:MAG: ATP-binding protein [Oceanococcus sp.]